MAVAYRGVAGAAVAAITQLLESILTKVDDMKALLLAQRVSRQFKNVTSDSPRLQKKLFMLPVSTFEEALDLGMIRIAEGEDSSVLSVFDSFTWPMGDDDRPLKPANMRLLNPLLWERQIFYHCLNKIKLNLHKHVDSSIISSSWKKM